MVVGNFDGSAPVPFGVWRDHQPLPLVHEKDALPSRTVTPSATLREEALFNPFADSNTNPRAFAVPSISISSPALQRAPADTASLPSVRIYDESGPQFPPSTTVDAPPVYTES